jgi:hypothetical protein
MIRPSTIGTGILLFGVLMNAATPTTTTLTSVTPATPKFGQTVTLTATVTPATTGFVAFMDQGELVGSAKVNATTGVAQATTVTLFPGRHTLVAVYGGNTSFSASTSTTLTYIVAAIAGNGFATEVPYQVELEPFSVAVSDFNRDGNADMVVANYGVNNVSVLLGNGNGTFQTAVNYAVGTNPYFVGVGDFNGDGVPDLVTANYGGDNVSVLLGVGNGTFGTAVNYNAGALPTFVAVGDFNGDGKADLAVADSQLGGGVSVLLGNGDGSFQTAVVYTAGMNPVNIGVADFNGDGKPDLAVANFGSSNVSVLLGNGNGTFQGAVNYPVGNGPASVALGDFNGDGSVDLAVAIDSTNSVNVLLGNGTGTFQAAVNYPVGTNPVSLATSDFNGDGVPDLAAANNTSNNVSVLLGTPNGTFQTAANYAASFYPQSVAVGDFNGDGRADLVAVNFDGGDVSVLLAAAPPVPVSLQFYPLPPCRIADTRSSQPFGGAFGPPSLVANSSRSFPILSSACSIPATAQAYSLNLTAVPSGPTLSFLSVWPAGSGYPGVSTLNSSDGSVIANAAIVPAGTGGGGITVLASNATDLIIDINGYFGPPSASGLDFFPLTPCRIADTRTGQPFGGAFGPPSLVANATRDFPIATSPCLSGSEQAYSLNVTVVPPQPLGFLSIWPTGQPFPVVSTLNATDGTTLANAALVPAGTSGDINVLASNTTDVILDINGKFAAPGSGGLQFYALTPCRVADTRSSQPFTGSFGPPSLAALTDRNFPIQSSPCGAPLTAQAYVLNMTVVPIGPLSFLSAWPAGEPFPTVSTLNSIDGFVIANAAIVPAGMGGEITVLADNPTDLIIDIVGYFAP